MGEVRIIISDITDDDECSLVLDYDGEISDKLKDLCSSNKLTEFIINGLSDCGFFSEKVTQ